MPPFFIALNMADDAPTAQEINDAVSADAESGVQSFSDGTNSVQMAPLKDRLEAAQRATRSSARGNPFLSHTRLIPGPQG